MKIADIKMHVLKSRVPLYLTSFSGLKESLEGTMEFSLVRILTDEGIEGDYVVWGEVPAARPRALAETLRALKPYLVGEDPLYREAIYQKLGSFWYGQKGPAFAAIDIALWDIAGKAADLPIYLLLGAHRDEIQAYASGNPSQSVDEIVNLALKLKKKGYKAMKLHPLSLEACRAVRENVGDEVILIHDAVFSYGRQEALRIGRELEKLNFYWYEAPLPAYDMEGYVELARKLDIPITVELLNNHLEYIQRGAIDICRAISGFSGGITELRKIAALCEMFSLKLEPHSFGGIFTQAANLHVMLSISNCDFFELPVDVNGQEGIFDVGTKGAIRIDKEGYVRAPNKPGLGLEVDWEQVKESTEVSL